MVESTHLHTVKSENSGEAFKIKYVEPPERSLRSFIEATVVTSIVSKQGERENSKNGTTILSSLHLKICPIAQLLVFEKTSNGKQQDTAFASGVPPEFIDKISDQVSLSHQALLSLVSIFLFSLILTIPYLLKDRSYSLILLSILQ